ncbi:NAD-dependent epimerase/dehydratase [Dichomitus squalens]|uniref:NAD-dependent epimerase/dehydratase n=1 Tax=Dichomitus squalens TaxID=114155 RepID=A0A4Q9MJG7_9APHY|nr:NAD-dependent epimerase/dehydratase [Dichomitus squalens]
MLDKSKLILITGGHGFIGGHVARKLVSLGYDVRVTDLVGRPPFAATLVKEVVLGNLCDPSFCCRVVQGVDVVLHFAATMGGMGTIHAANDFIIYQENHTMTTNLLSACKAAGVRGFFYASSACVYPESLQGSGVDVSLAEGDVWKHPPPHPQGLYGLEKLVSELGLHQHASTLQVRVARFHNIYGPMGSWYGGREKVPAAFLRKALAAKLSQDPEVHFEIWGDGSQRRSFCFIDDAVEAILRLLESDCSEPVNIGSDQAVSVRQLADIALRAASIDPESVKFDHKLDRPQGVGSRNSDNTFVKETLGWEPQVSLEEGMRRTGEWIREQLEQLLHSKTAAERSSLLRLLQSSDMVDLAADAITFAVLLPITSRGLSSPEECLANLGRFADSLLRTTADDVARLGERYQFHIYLAIDEDDAFLWRTGEGNAAEVLLREHGVHHITTLPPSRRPRGHVCALWRDCARRAFDDKCDYYVLMGDDVVLQDANWMSVIHRKFSELAAAESVPHGVGCVAFTDTSFPGFPTFPVVHRTHLEIFGGDVIPDGFTNQDGDPFLYQLYRRWGCSAMIASRLCNKLGGDGNARYDKVHAAGWTFQTLDNATSAVEAWLRQRAPAVQQKLTLDVVIPCYRVLMKHLDAFLALRASPTCTVMFVVVVDDPDSPRIHQLMQKYGDRPDVRIRVNAQNLGASYSRNRGLLESAAEWVHFLDDDVNPDANILIEAEKAIRAHPSAAGFVGNAHFPLAVTIFEAAVHLAGVTYFWDIAEKIAQDVPWGVTANLIARRNLADGLAFDLQFPKTGGGEDIDYCRKMRDYSLLHGGEGFFAAPAVKVTHPWWYGGKRTYWRFYMWSKGDGRLVKLYPEHSYRDFSPNAAECMLGSVLFLVLGVFVALFDVALGQSIIMTGTLFGVSMMVANVAHDLLRHLVLHPERVSNMRTTVSGWRWVAAVIEGAVIRVFSEWGRVIGLLERGEYSLLFMRFDWFCGVMGEAPRREEMWNNQTRAVLTVAVYSFLVRFL